MLKTNNPPDQDGETMFWINGRLVGHHKNRRFRDTVDLKINWFIHSAYVGGNWVSKRDQKVWDDQIVVATDYIGPLSRKPLPRWSKAVAAQKKKAAPRGTGPLVKIAGEVSAAEKDAREGKLEAAAEAYQKLADSLPHGPARTAMKLRVEGAASREALEEIILKRCKERGARSVNMEIGGRVERVRLFGGSEKEVKVKRKGGTVMKLPWKWISPHRLAVVAIQYASNVDDQFVIAKFVLACGETESARQRIEQAWKLGLTKAQIQEAKRLESGIP